MKARVSQIGRVMHDVLRKVESGGQPKDCLGAGDAASIRAVGSALRTLLRDGFLEADKPFHYVLTSKGREALARKIETMASLP